VWTASLPLLLPGATAAGFCFLLLLLGVSQPQMPLPEAGEAAAAAATLLLLSPKLRGVLGVCCMPPLGALEPLCTPSALPAAAAAAAAAFAVSGVQRSITACCAPPLQLDLAGSAEALEAPDASDTRRHDMEHAPSGLAEKLLLCLPLTALLLALLRSSMTCWW
jgi:hypothetical protein